MTSTQEAKKDHMHHRHNYASGLLWFIIIWIFIVLILWATKPKFIRRKNKGYGKKDDDHGDHHDKHQVDLGKAVLWAFIIALIICLIFWAFLYAGTGYGNERSNDRRWNY